MAVMPSAEWSTVTRLKKAVRRTAVTGIPVSGGFGFRKGRNGAVGGKDTPGLGAFGAGHE